MKKTTRSVAAALAVLFLFLACGARAAGDGDDWAAQVKTETFKFVRKGYQLLFLPSAGDYLKGFIGHVEDAEAAKSRVYRLSQEQATLSDLIDAINEHADALEKARKDLELLPKVAAGLNSDQKAVLASYGSRLRRAMEYEYAFECRNIIRYWADRYHKAVDRDESLVRKVADLLEEKGAAGKTFWEQVGQAGGPQ